MVTGYEAGTHRNIERIAEALIRIADSLEAIDDILREHTKKEQS